MMVVHEESVKPVEVPVIRKPHLEQKSYVIVKNHVREVPNSKESSSTAPSTPEESPSSSVIKETKRKRKTTKNLENYGKNLNSSETEEILIKPETQIDENDIKELRSVYKKCKEVISKIETKYGHLLGLEPTESSSRLKKRKLTTDYTSENECQCEIKKKIIFDEDGKESTVFLPSDNHICPKIKQVPLEVHKTISIEYNEQELCLPDSLQELGTILQNPDIDNTHRNQVIDKIRMIRQDYLNEIKFNKHAIKEKLKHNPDEELDFKGTNLATITGYL